MIAISHALVAEMLARASEYSNEVCGILGGERTGGAKRILCVEWVKNIDSNPESSYYGDPEQLVRALSNIEELEMELMGSVHSHPSGPDHPSEQDAKKATWSGYSHIILAPSEDYPISSWIWDDGAGRFVREEIVVE